MALWMNQGTINVVNGSKAVVGVGTKFQTAPIPARVGQPIVIGNVHYEIGSVNSDTSITLALNYAGATANRIPYNIITTAEGSFNDLSRRAAQVMGLYQGYMDVYEALFTGNGNVTVTLPDGDVITLPSWNTMQPKNSTLTSLSGKPVKTFGMDRLNDETKDTTLTALGASAFGKARLADADAAAARTALQLKKASQVDILGTVTSPNAAGLTGAIFERGINANGAYIKYADGTLVCYQNTTFTAGTALAFGSYYRTSNTVKWTYPAQFIAMPALLVYLARQEAGGSNGILMWPIFGGDQYSAATTPDIFGVASLSWSNLACGARMVAIGRWY